MTNSPEKEPSSHNGQRRSGIRLIPHYPRLSEDDRYWAKMEHQWQSEADEGGQIRITSRDIWDARGTITFAQKDGGKSPKKVDHGMTAIPNWVINLLLLLQGANLCIGILTWLILRGL